MAQKFQAKNVLFKAKNVNAGVDKDSVIEEVVAEANRFVSDPTNVLDGSKHTFSFQQEEEILVAIYAPEELIDPNSCELRIRQGHKGKVSYVTKFSNVKNPLTTKTVQVSWIFDSNSQYKSVLVINAQPARETPLELFYSEFTPNRIVKDESGKETMPYLGWEKDQVLAWFKDESKLRGCVLAITEDEYQKSSDWVRGDKFFNIPLPEKEEEKKEEESSEPDVTPFIGHEEGVADFISYAYCYSDGDPFTYNRCDGNGVGDKVVEENPNTVTEENLPKLLSDYEERYWNFPSWDEKPSVVADIIRNNKEAFLDVLGMVDMVMCRTFQNSLNDPHCWGEPFEDEDEEEAFQEDGPELDVERGFKEWVDDLDGSCYSDKYQKLIQKITEKLIDIDRVYENWASWLLD